MSDLQTKKDFLLARAGQNYLTEFDDFAQELVDSWTELLSNPAAPRASSSTHSLTVGTSKTFSLSGSGNPYFIGANLIVIDQTNSANRMWGEVTAVSGLQVTLFIEVIEGSGGASSSSWLLALSGARGAIGPAGSINGGTVTAPLTFDIDSSDLQISFVSNSDKKLVFEDDLGTQEASITVDPLTIDIEGLTRAVVRSSYSNRGVSMTPSGADIPHYRVYDYGLLPVGGSLQIFPFVGGGVGGSVVRARMQGNISITFDHSSTSDGCEWFLLFIEDAHTGIISLPSNWYFDQGADPVFAGNGLEILTGLYDRSSDRWCLKLGWSL